MARQVAELPAAPALHGQSAPPRTHMARRALGYHEKVVRNVAPRQFPPGSFTQRFHHTRRDTGLTHPVRPCILHCSRYHRPDSRALSLGAASVQTEVVAPARRKTLRGGPGRPELRLALKRLQCCYAVRCQSPSRGEASASPASPGSPEGAFY